MWFFWSYSSFGWIIVRIILCLSLEHLTNRLVEKQRLMTFEERKHVWYIKVVHTDTLLLVCGRIILCWPQTGEAISSEKSPYAQIIFFHTPGTKKPKQILNLKKKKCSSGNGKHPFLKVCSLIHMYFRQKYLFPKLILDRISLVNGKIVVHLTI